MKKDYIAPEAEVVSFDVEEDLLSGEPGGDTSVIEWGN